MKNAVFYSCLGVILLMHAVGLYGIVFSDDPYYYIGLTWVNLLVTGLCFVFYSLSEHAGQNLRHYLLAFVLIFITGFIVEIVGVKTGRIFGIYHYGDRLGWRFLEVPLIIGLNWGILIFSVAAITSRLSTNNWTRAWTGATLLVLLDLLIEPMAMRFLYWIWDFKTIPVQNFIAWWIISFFMLMFCFRFAKNLSNRLGIYVYFVQVIFFASLNLLLL